MINLTMLVRNRLSLTRQALGSLARATDLIANPVTILDDRSDKPTADLLMTYTQAHGYRSSHLLVNTIPTGTGELRNEVIRESQRIYGRGDLLYLSDNDVAFSPGWLETLARLYGIVRDEFAILGAYNHPFHQAIATTSQLDHAGHVVDEIYALATQSMIMSWEIWDRFSPFCQTPVDRVCQSEDTEFSNRIRAAGLRVGVVSPALIVATGITNTFGEPIPGWEAVKAQVPLGVICE